MALRIGCKGPEVLALQRDLAKLGYLPGVVDGDFGRNTERAVVAFQTKHDLYADGVVGSVTRAEIDKVLTGKPGLPVPGPPAQPPTERLTWEACPTDVVPGRDGYETTTLRSDTAKAFFGLCAHAHQLGGVVTSAGGKRALTGKNAKASANRSRKSMHYLGRAHDLSTATGMRNPDRDAYIITREGPESRYLQVWCRSALPVDRLMALKPPVRAGAMQLDALYMGKAKGGRVVLVKTVQAVVFDFTALALIYGFDHIPARPAFFSDAEYGAAEWWHTQWETGLVVNQTTFGGELLKIYTLDECGKFLYWDEVNACQWQGGGF